MMACPGTEQLEALLSGELANADFRRIESHIGDCADCQQTLDQLCAIEITVAEVVDQFAQPQPAVGNWSEQRADRLADAIREAQAESLTDHSDVGETRLPVIPGHKILNLIGRGGMGTVYCGRQLDLNREVAVKLLDAQLASDFQQLAKRFSHEAQVTANLDHPSIVPVHAIGREASGRLYYTMRLVRGRELKEVLPLASRAEQGWTRSRAIGVLIHVCQAIAFAHEHGVVHRDLKPSNVMVGDLGEVYVLDWGLARVLGREDIRDLRLKVDGYEPPHSKATTVACQDAMGSTLALDYDANRGQPVDVVSSDVQRSAANNTGSTDLPLLTMDGTVIGTPTYMPPEQAAGNVEKVDQRSDVYSLGTLLYQLLTGVAPYTSGDEKTSSLRILRAVLTGPPEPIQRLAPSAPPELVAICEKAMARRHDQRYASALELADELQAFLERRVVKAYQTGAFAEAKKWVVRNRSVALAGFLAVMATVGGLLINTWQEHRSNLNLSKANLRATDALDEQTRVSGELEKTNRQLGTTNVQLAKANTEITAAKESERQAKLEAYKLLAESYANFGEQEAAEQQYARASLWFTKAAEMSKQSPEVQQTHTMRAVQFGRAAWTPVAAWWDRQDLATRGWLNWPMTSQFLFDPSGRYLLLRGQPGTVIIDSRNDERQLWGDAWFEVAAFSPSAQHVAVSTKKGRVSIHRLSDGAELHGLLPEEHGRRVHALDYSHSGRLLFVGTLPAQIWDVEQARFLKGTYPIGDQIVEVGFSRDDRQILGEVLRQLKVFEISDEDGSHKAKTTSRKADSRKPEERDLAIQNKELRAPFSLRQTTYHGLAATSPDGTTLNHDFLKQFGGHGDASIHASAFDASGRHLAIAHGHGIVRIWRSPPRPYWFLRTNGMARPVFSPDSKLVAAIGHLALSDDEVAPERRKSELLSTQIFDPATGQPLGPEMPVGVPILDGCFSPDGRTMALACAVAERSKKTVLLPDGKAGSVQLWDWKSGKRLGEPIAMPSEPHTIAWHPSKGQVAVGCAAGQTLKIDVASRKVMTLFERNVEHHTWRWHPGEWDSCSMSFASAGDLLLWCFGGESHVLDFRSGEIRYSPPTWRKWSASLTSRNDVFLNSFVNQSPRALKLRQDRTWKWIKKPDDSGILTIGNGSVAKLSRDGRYVVSNGNSTRSTTVYDLEQRRIACPPFGERALDGDFIYGTPFVITAVEGNPYTVHFWDRLSGRIASPTLEIPGSTLLTWIRVAENGRFAAMTCHPYGVLVCDLQSFHDNPLQGVSPQDALNLAMINSGSQIYGGRISKLAHGEKWVELWDDFTSRHPDFHRDDIPLDLAIRDHQTRAAEFETLNNTAAAAFHRRMADALLAKPEAVKPDPAKVPAAKLPASLEPHLDTLTRAIEDQPERAHAWRHRAAWFASNRQWQRAADDLTQVLDLTPDDSQSYLRLSPLLILAGNQDGYRSICREMLKQFDNATAETTVEQTIKTCLLQREAVDLAALPIETLDKVLSAEEPTPRMLAWGSATRALYAFRAGDAQAAIDWADKSLDHSISSQQQALALSIQALSLRQLGDLEKAGEKLGLATDLIESALAEFCQDYNLRGWQDWLIADILRQEAQRRLAIIDEE